MNRSKNLAGACAAAFAVVAVPACAQDASVVVLPEIDVVSTTKEKGDGPVQGYRATRSVSGAKTDTPIKDIPQSIVVIPRQVLEDKGATNAADALSSVAGVNRGNNFGGISNYSFMIRGFETPVATKNGIYSERRYEADDMANVERIDVLMGPSGALYGRSDPSGFYNVVTKKPLKENFFTTTTSINSRGLFRESVDANYALSADKTVLARINAAVETGSSFRDYSNAQRVFVAPVITYTPNADWRFTLEAEYMNDQRPFDRGLVAPFRDVGRLPISRFLGEPNDDKLRNQYGLVSARVDHDINKDWKVHFVQQFKDGTLYGYTAEPVALRADNRTLTRRNTLRNYHWQTSNSQLEFQGKFDLAGFKNTVMFGYEHEYFHNREDFQRSNVVTSPYVIDVYNPIYGGVRPPVAPNSLFINRLNTDSLYGSLQTEWTSQLKTMVSLRWDSFNQTARQGLTGASVTQNPSPVIPKIGITYDLLPNLTLFADAAKSFRPNLDSDTGFTRSAAGLAFPPQKGTGYEAGVKWDVLDKKISITAAAFRIVKTNVITANPLVPGTSIAAGETTSKGFDINIAGNITPEWRIVGGYAYIDSRVTKDNTLPIGAKLANVPLNSANLFSVYEWQSGPLAGLGIGAGVNAADGRAGDANNTYKVPGFVKFDALAYYNINKDVKISLNVYNVFNTRYYEQVRSQFNVYPGQPLTALLTLKAKF